MTRADKLRGGFSCDLNEVLLERDSFVLCLQAQPPSDEGVAISNGGGNVRDFEPTRFAFVDGAPRLAERLQEEGLDEMRLELSGFRPLHLLLDLANTAHIHSVLSQGTFLEESLEVLVIESVLHLFKEPCANLGFVPVPNGLHEEV